MQSESTNKSQKNNKRRILIVCFVAFFLLGIYFLIGKPMIAFVGDADGFQEFVKSRGIFGLLVFGFFVFLQTLSNQTAYQDFRFILLLALHLEALREQSFVIYLQLWQTQLHSSWERNMEEIFCFCFFPKVNWNRLKILF